MAYKVKLTEKQRKELIEVVPQRQASSKSNYACKYHATSGLQC